MDDASKSNSESSTLRTERVIAATSQRIFAAFEEEEVLAHWWGPKGFTNTFERFEFIPGGRWVFVMHAPNGSNYANESIFKEIQRDHKIVLEHIVNPWFELTVTLTAQGEQTHLSWKQRFESPEVAAAVRNFAGNANEEVLDRLEAAVAARA